ncbi:MAG: hypothetical protein WB919_22750 [Candidatus Sulfotelmatobacter sp.]
MIFDRHEKLESQAYDYSEFQALEQALAHLATIKKERLKFGA